MPDTRSQRRPGPLLGALCIAVAVVGADILLRRWKRLPVATTRVTMLGVSIDPVTMSEALARMETYIRGRQPRHILTADALGIMQAQEDPELLGAMRQAALVTPDGAGVLLAAKMRGVRLPERVSGVDLVEQLSALAAAKGYLVYLFGASEGVAQAAAEQLKNRYPGLTIVGVRHGYFTAEEEPAIARDIARTHPDILFVALGIPKQEQFIRRYFTTLNVPVMIGIGGSFDVISGRLLRAPHWMQRTGLEWLFRLRQQPSRWSRMLLLPRFVAAAWWRRRENG